MSETTSPHYLRIHFYDLDNIESPCGHANNRMSSSTFKRPCDFPHMKTRRVTAIVSSLAPYSICRLINRVPMECESVISLDVNVRTCVGVTPRMLKLGFNVSRQLLKKTGNSRRWKWNLMIGSPDFVKFSLSVSSLPWVAGHWHALTRIVTYAIR